MIEWADARQPLESWSAVSDRQLPSAGLVTQVDQATWVTTADGRHVLIDGQTGGWIVCDDLERAHIEGLWNVVGDPAVDPVLEILWRRGLARIGGSDILKGVDVGAAIEGTRQRYTLVLLLSTGCNLACNYCYLGHRQPTADVAMPIDTALAAIDEALDQPWDEVMFDFGEIAVAGGRFETLALAAVAKATERGKRARIAIQSNATTIDAQLADRLAMLDAVVGISLDGPAEIHDSARQFRSGAGSYDRVTKALALLAERSVSVHLIATIGRHNVDRPIDVVEELASHKPTSFLLKPVLAEGEAGAAWDQEGVSAEEYGTFMTTVVRYASVHGAEYLDQTATKFMNRLLGDRNGWRDSCTSRSCGSGRSLHVVDPNGRSHACPRFVDEAPSARSAPVALLPTRRTTAPTVVRPSLADLLPSGLRSAPADCGGCPWLASCGGGCTLISRDPDQPTVPQPDPHCVSYDAIHRELVRHLLPAYLDGAMCEAPLFNGALVRRFAGSQM